MTKPQQSLVFKSTKPVERFSVYLPLNLEGDSPSHSDSLNHEDEWMLGLTASEAKNSVFNISKENNRFFMWKIEEKYSGTTTLFIQSPKTKNQYFGPQDLKDETKRIGLNDFIIMRAILDLGEDGMECNVTSNNFEVSVSEKFSSDYEQSVFQDFEGFLRTMRLEEEGIDFFRKI